MEMADEGIASEGGQSGRCMLFPRQGLLLPVLILLLERVFSQSVAPSPKEKGDIFFLKIYL